MLAYARLETRRKDKVTLARRFGVFINKLRLYK